MANQQRMDKKKLALLLVAILLIAGVAVVLFLRDDRRSPAFEGDPADAPSVQMPDIDLSERQFRNDIVLPIGDLIITDARSQYEDGAMRLVIPKLELDCPVLNGTDLATLSRGVGLYEYSQIPDIYNTNVSIAGHRDLYGYEFYYLDTVGEGDFIYLVYGGIVFQYNFLSAEILTDTYDWDSIRVHADSRVTLTTCDPIGTSLNRLVVTGELVDFQDYTEAYVFQ